MNNFFKCLLIVLFCFGIFVSITACGDDDDDDNDDNDDSADDDDFGDDDDDNDTTDDDTTDDDTGDDDTTDDDTSDDDTIDDDTIDDDTGDDDTTVGFSVDFEDYPLGELNNPDWHFFEIGGATLLEIVELESKASGKGLHVDAGFAEGDEVIVKYGFPSIMENYTIQFDLKVLSGTYSSLTIYQKNGNYLYPEFGIELDPFENTLRASYNGFIHCIPCSLYNLNEWNQITMVVDWENAQYSLLFDGEEDPACKNLGFAIGDGMPLNSLIIVDPPNADFGGNLYLDNILGQPIIP